MRCSPENGSGLHICDQLSLFKKETGAPAVSAVPVTHIQVAVAAAAPVIVPAAPAVVECISNQEGKKSWQMQLLSSLLSSLCCLPEKAHINI